MPTRFTAASGSATNVQPSGYPGSGHTGTCCMSWCSSVCTSLMRLTWSWPPSEGSHRLHRHTVQSHAYDAVKFFHNHHSENTFIE